MPVTLMYHDVVSEGQGARSGFPGAAADRYKLTVEQFSDHLGALAITGRRFTAISKLIDAGHFSSEAPCLLTFDDGGVSAHTTIGAELEARGWLGHFFITSNFINKVGFLSAEQIRDLHRRGHVIGSHSCSHPIRISACPPEQVFEEWRASRSALEQLLGVPVEVASVPGGFYSRQVGIAAARAGIRVLFTSEPTTRIHKIDRCHVLGRYAIVNSTSPKCAAALVRGRHGARLRQAIHWEARKLAKAVIGPAYLRIRSTLLEAGK